MGFGEEKVKEVKVGKGKDCYGKNGRKTDREGDEDGKVGNTNLKRKFVGM